MKVLMLTPSFFPIVGGTERIVQDLALKLNENGIQTDVMTFNMNEKWNPVWKEEIKKGKLKVFKVPAFNVFHKIGYNPLGALVRVNVAPNLRFVTRLKDYDILHFHDDVDLTLPSFSCFIKRPKVFHCHTLTDTYKHYKTAFISRTVLKRAGHSYICVSNFSKNLLMDLGIPGSRIFVSHNGVDIDKFRPGKAERSDNLLLFVGRSEKRKGLHVLLNSLAYIEMPVRLKIVGPAPQHRHLEQEFRPNIRQKTSRHEIEWLGKLSENKLIELYQKASVFVCPSLNEDFGVVNLEALSCETPVVASQVGGVGEVVEQNINGILVPPNNPKKLADALRKLLENRDLREMYGKNGRKMVEDHFSWDNIAKGTAKIYEKTIQARIS